MHSRIGSSTRKGSRKTLDQVHVHEVVGPQDAEELVDRATKFQARNGKRVSIPLAKGANIKADKKHAAMELHKTLRAQETTWHGKAQAA